MAIDTLYINNLPESLKPPTLIPLLHDLFIPFGPIIAIHAQHTLKKKAQAFVTFSHVNCAMTAKTVMDGHSLLARQMKVEFAKTPFRTKPMTLSR
jgi:U2 small nuclear ribonucleoprotein B''